MMSHGAENEDLKTVLAPVLEALSSLGGYFVFTDDEGRQFVIAAKAEFERRTEEKGEQQLSFEPEQEDEDADEDITDYVNRDIALARGRDDLAIEPPAAANTVRFEPLTGDLPPELQE